MEIKVDTLLMQQMASCSLRAQKYLKQASETANAITIHDDWNCKERDLINDNVMKIQKHDGIICENMIVFSTKVNELASRFEEFDKLLSSKFSTFDSSIGDMYNAGNATTYADAQLYSVNEADLKQALTFSGTNSYWDQYHVSNLTKPISVVNFGDSMNVLEGFEE